jgi:two-component system NtrC family sensor kinase
MQKGKKLTALTTCYVIKSGSPLIRPLKFHLRNHMDRHIRFFFLSVLLFLFSSGHAAHLIPADSSYVLKKNGQSPKEIERYDALCLKAEQATDADSIMKYSNEAIEMAEELGVSPSRPLLLKGNGLHLSGKLTLAVECFTAAAQLYRQENNAIGVATAYTYMSEAYISQQNHNNAKLYLRRAIDIFKEENDSTRLASALHNLGFEYYRTQQYDSALILFANSAAVYHKLHYETGIAYCIGNSGLVYSKLNKLDKAEKRLLKAIGMLEKHDDARAVADFTIEYAHVQQRKGKITDAIQSAHKSLSIASRNNITELKRDAAYRLSKIYEQIYRYDSAFHYLLVYYTYSDSIRNIESIQKTADLRTEFEVAQKQAEVDILEKNKSMQRIIIVSLGVIILLAAGFIVMIYISLKRNRRLTGILEERRKQLEKQSSELRELNHIKDRFFSIISHDLRAPIASISGISFMIKESVESDNRALLNQVTDYIDQSVISLTGLLENMLNWALSQQGKFPYKVEEVELESIIGEVVKTFVSVTLSKNQNIRLNLEPGLVIQADKNSMMTIIRNLLSNALKFTDREGRITITTRTIDNGFAEIRVDDTGIGIPEEKMADLFKLKDDKSSRGTDNEKGIGLGLNLVQEFVTLNKGTIQAKSKVGEGSSFILRFPMKV